MYPSTTGRFSATIGYVAPTPNHVRGHHVQQSKIRVPIQYSANHEPNVPSRAPSRAQTPNPSNPTKGTPKGETHKGGPPLCPRNNSHPLPSPPPAQKTLKKTPLPTLAARVRSPYCHVSITHTKTTRSQLRLVIQGRGHGPMSRRSATAPSSFWHTLCP